jgi:hypothetical protein
MEKKKKKKINIVEAESAPTGISLVWSHVLGRGSLPLYPELPPVVQYIAYMGDSPADLTFYSTILTELHPNDKVVFNR